MVPERLELKDRAYVCRLDRAQCTNGSRLEIREPFKGSARSAPFSRNGSQFVSTANVVFAGGAPIVICERN